MDPRNYQIVALSTFVVFGVSVLGFNIQLSNAITIIGAALITQYGLFSSAPCFSNLVNDAKSALISALSLVLLLRTDMLLIAALAAIVAIASKRFLRFNGHHLFNPSAFALVLVTGLSSHAYLSPGQWGALGLFAFGVMGVGLLVVTRAQRLDVSLAFLLTFAALVLFRGWFLGDPIEIAWHQLQSGALLLFAFFMITDPKTTPVNARPRIIFGVLVSVLAFVLQFYFYVTSAAIYALIILAPLVAVFNFNFRENTHAEKNVVYHGCAHASEFQQRDGFLRLLRGQG